MFLTPDYYYDSVFEIPYADLWQNGLRGLIFDLDNTLAAYDHSRAPAKIVALVKRLTAMGFAVCLVTNNTNRRLRQFDGLGLQGVANAAKPLTGGLRRGMAMMGTQPAHTAIIGDQLLSDVWGGKRAGLTTVLVKPISDKDMVFVKLKRIIERRLLRQFFADRGMVQ